MPIFQIWRYLKNFFAKHRTIHSSKNAITTCLMYLLYFSKKIEKSSKIFQILAENSKFWVLNTHQIFVYQHFRDFLFAKSSQWCCLLIRKHRMDLSLFLIFNTEKTAEKCMFRGFSREFGVNTLIHKNEYFFRTQHPKMIRNSLSNLLEHSDHFFWRIV